jgi:uncharacterized membrane protein
MLSGLFADAPTVFAFILQTSGGDSGWIHAPTVTDLARISLRWAHFVAGITWIGLLYFFNLVNVPFQKKLDAPTKKIVNPELLPRALWYFRWGAVVTVLAGLTYYAMYIMAADAGNAGANIWAWLGLWLVVVLVFYAIVFGLIKALDNGNLLAILIAILVLAMGGVILYLFRDPNVSNKTLSIGIGGGLGIWMMLNVWGIIWPAQKRIIAATVEGTTPPAELARKAFLASRTNAWLSLVMLFFMATSHGDYIIFGK